MAINSKNSKAAVKPAQKHVWGRVTESKQRTVTLVCDCGNKYIKTRKGQVKCLWCIAVIR